MKTIWKYTLRNIGVFSVDMPQNAQVLCVQTQDSDIQMWVLCDPEQKKERRYFEVVPTGAKMEDISRMYMGTVQFAGGRFVFHVFETPIDSKAIHITGE